MSERRLTLEQLRRKLVQVDSYTDGWDIVVGKVMERATSLEHRVDELETQLADMRKALRRARIAVP